MSEINKKTIELVQLAVDMAISISQDIKEPRQRISQDTIEIHDQFIDLYNELNDKLDDEGTLQ